MKKKTKILLTVLIFLLLIPIPNGTLKDGGTKAFTSLTYKVVSWNKLVDANGIYHKTEFYIFPFNFLSLDTLWESKTDRFAPENTEADTCSVDHTPAKEEQTVPDAYEGGWCGNTQASFTLDGKTYKFELSDAISLNSLYLNHSFPEEVCECDGGIEVWTETGEYTVNLEKYFVRSDKGQGRLTRSQVDAIKEIIERQSK